MGYWQGLHNHISVLDHIIDYANIQVCQAAVTWHLLNTESRLVSNTQLCSALQNFGGGGLHRRKRLGTPSSIAFILMRHVISGFQAGQGHCTSTGECCIVLGNTSCTGYLYSHPPGMPSPAVGNTLFEKKPISPSWNHTCHTTANKCFSPGFVMPFLS